MNAITDLLTTEDYARAVGMPVADEGHLEFRKLYCANDSRFNQANFNQPLTTYAVGGWDKVDGEAELNFWAPAVPVSRRFTYKVWSNAEAFLSENEDDARAELGDFKRVEYKTTEVNGKTINRGLVAWLDRDEIAGDPGMAEQRHVDLIMRRLKRNSIRRAVALLSATAVNNAKTWDNSAGKDPDLDVLQDITAGADLTGIRNNRVGFGRSAWDKRGLSHRSQTNAGGFASAAMTAQTAGGIIGVETVFVSENRFQSAAATKSQIVGSKVLSFYAQEPATVDDPSHIKRFTSPTESGGPVRVFRRDVNAKIIEVGVEMYELTAITFATGIRQLTIS